MTRPRILVVEDDRVLGLELAESIQAMDYMVLGVVASAEEALQKAADNSLDLVIMDVQLKGRMDGVQAAADPLCTSRFTLARREKKLEEYGQRSSSVQNMSRIARFLLSGRADEKRKRVRGHRFQSPSA